MNKPVAIERAQAGRKMFFPDVDWESNLIPDRSVQTTQSDERSMDNCLEAVSINDRVPLDVPRKKRLHLRFTLVNSNSGLIMSMPLTANRRRDRFLITLSAKNSRLIFSLIDSDGLPKSVVETGTNIYPGSWTEVHFHIDGQKAILTTGKQVQGYLDLPRRSRSVGHLVFGGHPAGWEHNVALPAFEGCLKHVKVNAIPALLHNTVPCKTFC